MPDTEHAQALVAQALAGHPSSVRALIDHLAPVVSKRIAAVLWQRTHRRDVGQEVADMTQDVLLSLFESGGRALRAWNPERGLSLERFVGLLAHHQVISILRRGRTSPWREEPTDGDDLERISVGVITPEAIVGSRERLSRLLDDLRENLSPRGLELFQRLIVDGEDIEEVIATTGLTRDALYQWKSRILRLIRQLAKASDESPPPTPPDRPTGSLSESASGRRITKGAVT